MPGKIQDVAPRLMTGCSGCVMVYSYFRCSCAGGLAALKTCRYFHGSLGAGNQQAHFTSPLLASETAFSSSCEPLYARQFAELVGQTDQTNPLRGCGPVDRIVPVVPKGARFR